MNTQESNFNKPEIHICEFCGKECKNLNSYKQHRCRCKENPNRKSYCYLENYIKTQRKGRNKSNCIDISKQSLTLKQKYDNGYIHPLAGKKVNRNYFYKEHNDFEIQKWLNHIRTVDVNIPKYDTINHNSGYKVISKSCEKEKSTVRIVFEHDFLANILLEGTLQPDNTVHHIDFDGTNNSLDNLLVFESKSHHSRFHASDYSWISYNEETHLFTCELRK